MLLCARKISLSSVRCLHCSVEQRDQLLALANNSDCCVPREKLFAISSNSSSVFPRKYSAYSSHNSSYRQEMSTRRLEGGGLLTDSKMFRTTRATCLSVDQVLGYRCLIDGAASSIHLIKGSKMCRTGLSSHPHSSRASC